MHTPVPYIAKVCLIFSAILLLHSFNNSKGIEILLKSNAEEYELIVFLMWVIFIYDSRKRHLKYLSKAHNFCILLIYIQIKTKILLYVTTQAYNEETDTSGIL